MVKDEKSQLRKARFPERSGRARRVEDKSSMCRKWRRNDACRLDTDFDNEDPGSPNVESWTMFTFMNMVCPRTCKRSIGYLCVDENSKCEEWARNGMCMLNPVFMALTCRESCGVCGFLSPDNKVMTNKS